MSAWKKPSRKTCVKKISTPLRPSVGMSMPAARIASRSFTGMASILSITMTSFVHQSKYTSGT